MSDSYSALFSLAARSSPASTTLRISHRFLRRTTPRTTTTNRSGGCFQRTSRLPSSTPSQTPFLSSTLPILSRFIAQAPAALQFSATHLLPTAYLPRPTTRRRFTRHSTLSTPTRFLPPARSSPEFSCVSSVATINSTFLCASPARTSLGCSTVTRRLHRRLDFPTSASALCAQYFAACFPTTPHSKPNERNA